MFEAAELKQSLSKKDYKALLPQLREELLAVQRELREAGDFPVIVLFGGVDGAGKHETVNALNEWLDPRWIVARAYGEPSDEERERPEQWRYWRDLPPKGQVGLFLSAWYSRPLLARVRGESDDEGFATELGRIADFEQMLTADGALVVKFWMHLDHDCQRERLQTLEADPLTAWQVQPKDWSNLEQYDQFIAAAKQLITRTGNGEAPWEIIDGFDPHYRAVAVATHLRDAIRRHLSRRAEKPSQIETPRDGVQLTEQKTVLSALAPDLTLERKEYRQRLKAAQARLAALQRRAKAANLSTVLMFEGWDAAGKGGAIRRVIHALDARHYRVIPIAAPTDEEHTQHYLWRFWRYLPRAGRVTIFDRSWYGRVLVERVEGYAGEDEWRRAYAEINQFEADLTRNQSGYRGVLCKFWLHITEDEQLDRFKAREAIPYKAWKLTDEDWRNREKWPQYEQAVDELVRRTSTDIAPWTLIEANQKEFARVKVIETVCERVEQALEEIDHSSE